MATGLKRVAMWSAGFAILFGGFASVCNWGFGIPPIIHPEGVTEITLRHYTITGYFFIGLIMSLIVAGYCVVHMEDDSPGAN